MIYGVQPMIPLQNDGAAVEWDAIRIPRYVAASAMNRIEGEPGPVLVDPRWRVLYFLVPHGTADWWREPNTTALTGPESVALPPSHRARPPGPYWLVQKRARPWSAH